MKEGKELQQINKGPCGFREPSNWVSRTQLLGSSRNPDLGMGSRNPIAGFAKLATGFLAKPSN
ncbi:hypothetical protein SLEP1_g45070 [Rubroshorea leprosula]|uniref:Uncharacterized protein n=1 Tax=Rubroshorea leprosula TaxID=152421 RepID=A0AAV5LI24_9ROSI|nr:hypothetical protein SLEP1_g45070 [Rubroshorea leprosula]